MKDNSSVEDPGDKQLMKRMNDEVEESGEEGEESDEEEEESDEEGEEEETEGEQGGQEVDGPRTKQAEGDELGKIQRTLNLGS